jgi:hypothetical protein
MRAQAGIDFCRLGLGVTALNHSALIWSGDHFVHSPFLILARECRGWQRI